MLLLRSAGGFHPQLTPQNLESPQCIIIVTGEGGAFIRGQGSGNFK